MPDEGGHSVSDLAQRQADLVAALVAGADDPPGFSGRHLAAVRAALLAKRAEEVARLWPRLAAAHGERWTAEFSGWAAGRPPQGSLRDGWDYAHHHELTADAARELAAAKRTFALRRNALQRRRWRGLIRRLMGI